MTTAAVRHEWSSNHPRSFLAVAGLAWIAIYLALAPGLAIELERVEAIKDIMAYGILSTPGVVIDGQVVHAGGVPTRAKVEALLEPKTQHSEAL